MNNTIEQLKPFTNSFEEATELLDLLMADSDIEFNGFRFILGEDIDKIQQNELESDPYILGCFNSNFLAGISNISLAVWEALDSAEAFEAKGELILEVIGITTLQKAYSNDDGYGNHFSHYDHSEEEIMINGNLYYVFNIEGNNIDEWNTTTEPAIIPTIAPAVVTDMDHIIRPFDDKKVCPNTGIELSEKERIIDFTKIKFSDLF